MLYRRITVLSLAQISWPYHQRLQAECQCALFIPRCYLIGSQQDQETNIPLKVWCVGSENEVQSLLAGLGRKGKSIRAPKKPLSLAAFTVPHAALVYGTDDMP